MNGRLVTTGLGAVTFKTMVALYVEVEMAHWERGSSPLLCKVILMTGIHGQCQMQVDMWMLFGTWDRLLLSNPVEYSVLGSWSTGPFVV